MPDRISLILVPGFLSNAVIWRNQAAAFSAAADIHITEQSRTHDTVQEMVEAILRDAPERFALAGHSFGGFVALAAALAAPDRVIGLAMINSTADLTLPADQERKRRGLKRLADGGDVHGVTAWAQKTFLGRETLRGDHWEALIADMVRATGTDAFARQLSASMRAGSLKERLNEVRCPTLLVCSRNDVLLTCTHSRDIARGIRRSTLIEIDGRTHLTPLENPSRLNDALEDWLAGLRPR